MVGCGFQTFKKVLTQISHQTAIRLLGNKDLDRQITGQQTLKQIN